MNCTDMSRESKSSTVLYLPDPAGELVSFTESVLQVLIVLIVFFVGSIYTYISKPCQAFLYGIKVSPAQLRLAATYISGWSEG